jgi:phosphatidylglycerophosphate synthase
MIDSNCRTPYQRLLIDPLLKRDFGSHVSPLWVTFLGAAFGLLIPLFLYFHLSVGALLFLGISGFCDTLDGSLARHQHLTSPKGAAIDIVADRLVEWAILLGLFLYAPETRGFLTIWMLGAALICITTFLVVGIFQENASKKSFHYSPGLIERTEAFIFFSLMIAFPSLFTPLALLFGGLTLFTAYKRMRQFLKASLNMTTSFE